ncbi:tRNA-U16,U17-dihydrouridine synthase [Phaeovulum vinaykumarii]|uniref:tRNA-dihydrouridine(20/20a) synthase n=2 Tax=Phaeovulum vinaykumarii TaxID=407234 RepID=A0A1N7LK71_9RHOB|nr:tRNA-U16,U17-dihydrouridine synthase [Phaeovulum vinaykumarii]SOC04930.1 tRNA-U16,U17-dihydrouridine synthase [Phaeovulum vinaykumarii]
MMDWTDRHCRRFHRAISSEALLYSEMVTAPAVIHGDRERLLGHDGDGPVALQLGGSDPAELGQATRIAADWGYDEINLNCGCPSDRVQSGAFGAVLMKTPELVAECLAAMMAESPVPVTLKCRIGVDDQEPREILPALIERLRGIGLRRLTIHARKAWLQGLSPKDNREIPPLDYPLVLEMKRAFPDLHISLNGGVGSLAEAEALLAQGLDGVMVGRAAYAEPFNILGAADARLWGHARTADPFAVARAMEPWIEAHLARGGRLHQVTRHMLGLFHGRPGARGWRRILSERATGDGAGLEVYRAALAAVRPG